MAMRALETSRLKILIADSHFQFRRVLAETASADRYVCLEAEDAEMTCRIAGQSAVDLVLLSAAMPDSVAAVQALREDKRTRSIPILLLTGGTEQQQREAERAIASVDLCLHRTFGPNEFLQAIRSTMGKAEHAKVSSHSVAETSAS